ncbi:Uncharacterised protein [Mycobacteroides abscessus subsp. abscessus]|nr:Uncharacterised protein [Mycobacteroides abscessus subsp. abscessus]
MPRSASVCTSGVSCGASCSGPATAEELCAIGDRFDVRARAWLVSSLA